MTAYNSSEQVVDKSEKICISLTACDKSDNMKALYLSLVLFIGSSSVTVSGCICDASKHINIKVVNSVGKNLGAIKNKLGTASR